VSSALPFVSDVRGFRGASDARGLWGTASVAAVSGRFRFARVRRDMGSKEMMRGFGWGIGAMSTASSRLTLVSHEVVGEMVVGRVSVAVSM
jgi:TnpA family transposase